MAIPLKINYLIEEYKKWVENCHIELGVMAHRSQLFHESLLLIRIINLYTRPNDITP